MDITVKYVSASGEGDYFGMSFDNDDPDDDGQDYEPSGRVCQEFRVGAG